MIFHYQVLTSPYLFGLLSCISYGGLSSTHALEVLIWRSIQSGDQLCYAHFIFPQAPPLSYLHYHHHQLLSVGSDSFLSDGYKCGTDQTCHLIFNIDLKVINNLIHLFVRSIFIQWLSTSRLRITWTLLLIILSQKYYVGLGKGMLHWVFKYFTWR